MARYIDADLLIEQLQPAKNAEWNKNDHTASRSQMIEDFCTELKNAPTADVVPKSEVASEIFAEIDREICLALESNYKARDHRQMIVIVHGSSTLDREFIEYVCGKIDTLRGINDFVAELKKKYIGE